MMQLLWKTVWQFPPNLKHRIDVGLGNPLPGMYTEASEPQTTGTGMEVCMLVFTEIVCTLAKATQVPIMGE